MDRAAGPLHRRARASSPRSAARRLGPVLCMGPFNYPLNETFTTLVPALVMGNTVVAQAAAVRDAPAQAPLLKAFADAFPRGVVNVVNGRRPHRGRPGRRERRPRGAHFIGPRRVAERGPKKQHPWLGSRPPLHPRPRRQEPGHRPRRRRPRPRCPARSCTGALSFNGQRCTALKLGVRPEARG